MDLNKIAQGYYQLTNCDEAQAKQVAFVAAALLSDMVNRKDLGDYFTNRATDMEKEGEKKIVRSNVSCVNSSYTNRENWGWY